MGKPTAILIDFSDCERYEAFMSSSAAPSQVSTLAASCACPLPGKCVCNLVLE